MKTPKSNKSKQPMNGSGKLRTILEILVVIALILIIPLFFAIKSVANAPTAQSTGTPYPIPSGTNLPQSNPSASSSVSVKSNGKEPPACTFPLTQITTTKPMPENYTFSQPQAVLTAPQGNLYHIAEWLPDNQQVLMTEDLNNSNTPENQINPENIELFNPVTGDVKVYATRLSTHEPPSWDSALNAVLYPVMNYYDIDKKNGTYKFNRQLWVSYGNSKALQMFSDKLSQLPFATKPNGGETIYLTDSQISKLDKSLKGLPSLPFDPSNWDYATRRRNKDSVSYMMAWQPGTSLVFLYSEGAMGGGGYTFILNVDRGDVCELNLGGWAQSARWSSDGRYLAFIRSTTYAFPFYSSDLTILDTITGNLTVLNVIDPKVEGSHLVDALAWAPDNRHLLAIGDIYTSPDTQDKTDLYLVDFVSGQSVNVEPDHSGFVFSEDNNFAWSPDGSKVIIHCPSKTVDQLCLISVQQTGK
jgi:hypothetical protein